MKNCKGCVFADWDKTKAGKLHPSGMGRCKKVVTIPPIPAAFYWMQMGVPRPSGGMIDRHRDNADHCAYYTRNP